MYFVVEKSRISLQKRFDKQDTNFNEQLFFNNKANDQTGMLYSV